MAGPDAKVRTPFYFRKTHHHPIQDKRGVGAYSRSTRTCTYALWFIRP